MQAMQAARRVGSGRKLVGILVLAVALAYGSLAAASGDSNDGDSAGCGAGPAAVVTTAAPEVEWSSSPGMPGEPY